MALDLAEPSVLWVPEHEFSSGLEVVELARTFGREHDPEQQLVLDLMYAERRDGRHLTLEFGLVVERQNLKTFTAESAAIADLFLFDNELVAWTAHRFSTTQESFARIVGIVENYDHLRRRVKRITTGNGDEAIELLSGARLIFLARSNVTGRGLTGDVLFFDEAFALSAGMMGALMPTLSSVPNPHIRYLSSPGLANSAHLRDLRDRGRPGHVDPSKGDPSLTWLEWGDPRAWQGCKADPCSHHRSVEGCALDDRSRWFASNPAMIRGRISEEFVAAERRSLSWEEFARERVGWWDEPRGESAFTSEAWEDGLDEESDIEGGHEEFALDVAPDQSAASIAVAGLTSDDATHVELTGRDGEVDSRPGMEWVVPVLADMRKRGVVDRIAIAAGSAAEALAPAIEKLGLEVVRIPETQVSAACGHLYGLVSGRRLRHVGQEELDDAVTNARRVDVGDKTWKFGRRKSTGDISALYAVTLAAWRVGMPSKFRPLDDSEIYSGIH